MQNGENGQSFTLYISRVWLVYPEGKKMVKDSTRISHQQSFSQVETPGMKL
ncbi:MAG: hypothetical protein ACI8ZB_000773 [Desulforhopalus sp.]|jgi:hypothetical protein